jgi:hypothetical protein
MQKSQQARHGLRSAGRFAGWLTLTVILAALPGVDALAMASHCGPTGECVCITWTVTGGAVVEVRCPAGGTSKSGWSDTGDPKDADGSRGSYGGAGARQSPPSPLPGTILDPITTQAVTNARKTAIEKTRGTKIVDEGTGKQTWEANECTNLFNNSPLGLKGAYLLGSYLVFRDGTGVKDGNNRDVCATGVPAWTTCCDHDPVVFICPGSYSRLTSERQAFTLIHEALHVAGQKEDTNTTVGPGDPPNTSQIGADVASACH